MSDAESSPNYDFFPKFIPFTNRILEITFSVYSVITTLYNSGLPFREAALQTKSKTY